MAGIDWAVDDHAVAVLDEYGEVVERFTVAHTAAGMRALPARLRGLGVVDVAIERPDGQVVDTVLAAGFTVPEVTRDGVAAGEDLHDLGAGYLGGLLVADG